MQPDGETPPSGDDDASRTTDYGTLVNSGEYDGLPTRRGASTRMIGGRRAARHRRTATVQYRLKDWGISRQRYWGTPIPMIYCEKDGIVPVPDDELPVVLPKVATFTGRGDSPLAQVPEFVNATCPEVRRPGAARDRHDGHVRRLVLVLLPLLRSAEHRPAVRSRRRSRYWMPVDFYSGGVEHAILHLIYSRFFTRVFRDLGLVDHRRAVHAPADAGHGAQGRRR